MSFRMSVYKRSVKVFVDSWFRMHLGEEIYNLLIYYKKDKVLHIVTFLR